MVRAHISRDRHITEVYYIYAPLRLMQSITSFSLTPTIVPSPQLIGKCRVVVTSLCSTGYEPGRMVVPLPISAFMAALLYLTSAP